MQNTNELGLADLQLPSELANYIKVSSAEKAWQKISKDFLLPTMPFALHKHIFSLIYPNWQDHPYKAAAWIPDKEFIATTNLSQCMAELQLQTREAFHQWSVTDREHFWEYVIAKLNIAFNTQPKSICDLSQGVENPRWLVGAKLNITSSCFTAPSEKTAVLFQNKEGALQEYSYDELDKLSNRIANGLARLGYSQGDVIAIDMPMTVYAIAIYLGIIKIGGIVASIADSFSTEEIATRLKIAKAQAIFTQDIILRNNKILPLYEKIAATEAPRAIVFSAETKLQCKLKLGDLTWEQFISENEDFSALPCDPMMPCNILFSSGTTSDPKAIVWNHTTGIKVASDAYFHQNVQVDDRIAWPTNLGWMMGPWLIFAALINQACIALYDDVPRTSAFGKFIQDASVTILGVVPTLVANWRQSQCMQGLDWSRIRLFSSTGECSNPEDMLYLMSLAGYKPVIEYCGGTEIGGAYLSSTVIENNYLSVFTTQAMGIDFKILDEHGHLATQGEVALIPPSIGLSTQLINADHHQTYFANMPKTPKGELLRRHGDQIQTCPDGVGYCVLGRVDDTMNLGGIKISSAEIERALVGIENVIETAAIAISPHQQGPSSLVIFAAVQNEVNKDEIKKQMQLRINQHLNPLFKIDDVILTTELPKTASNKIMRRILRKQYQEFMSK